MDEQTRRPVLRHIVEALEASTRDIASGNVHDARSVQGEARRMLADHERARATAPDRRRRSGPRRLDAACPSGSQLRLGISISG